MKYEKPDVEVLVFVAQEPIASLWPQNGVSFQSDVVSNGDIVIEPTIKDWPED